MNSQPDLEPAAKDTPEKPLRIAIQGYPGAFHEIAARHFFQDQELEMVPADTFEELIEMVEQGQVSDIGIMAIENTLYGSLMGNYTLLNQSQLSVSGEVYLRIKQNLLVLPGQSIADLKEVHSHPIAIAQCLDFFKKHPHIHLVETCDTAWSAQQVSEQQLFGTGAIASTLAAEMYGLDVLAPSIETNKKNFTRFLILERPNGKEPLVPADEVNKISMSFAVSHEVGSLYKVLAVLAAYNVNLTKIQSHPIIGKPWEYLFFVDFTVEGSVGHEQAIDAIRPLTHDLQVLGVYRKGNHYEY